MADTKVRAHRSPRTKKSTTLLGTIVGYLLVLLLVCFLLLIFGRVSGTEISADTLERRTYTFFQIPVVQLQCTPIWRSTIDDSLADYVRNAGHLLPNSKTNRWDVIQVDVGGRSMAGKAEILEHYLEMSAGDDHEWEFWTIEHPRRGKILWRTVHQAVQLEAYELIPYFFEVAAAAAGADELQQKLDSTAAKHYAELAADYGAAGETERAAELYQTSLNHQEIEEHRRAFKDLQTQL